jgi:tripartite-type tricarboxylate transporter receptor subunit TctC
MIMPFAAGGGTDLLARALAQDLTERLGQPFIIDNRAGAGGNIAAGIVAKAAPDGYTIIFGTPGPLANNKLLYKNLPFDPEQAFAPVVLIAKSPLIVAARAGLPVKDIQELAAYAKANPGKLNFGSTGIGSSMHLAGELFMRETGAQMIHVPYNAPGTATTNLIAGEIQLMFQLIPGIAGQVKSGKVRALAVLAPQRSPALPDVPTTAELGQPRLLSSTWFALLAPKSTPPAVIARMNAVSNEILTDPAVKKRLAEMGANTLGGTPQQLAEHLSAETEKWGRVVRDAHISAQ